MLKGQFFVWLFSCPDPDQLHRQGKTDAPYVEYLMIHNMRLVETEEIVENEDKKSVVRHTFRLESSYEDYILIDDPPDAFVSAVLGVKGAKPMPVTRLCRHCRAKNLSWAS